MVRQRRSWKKAGLFGGGDFRAVVLPVAEAPPLDRSRVYWWGWWRHGEPRSLCRPGPHLFYMALATGAHQPFGLGAPDQDASRGWHLAVGPNALRSF